MVVGRRGAGRGDKKHFPSMCSTPADTSAGRCPARPQADTRGGGPDSRGARGQTSPLANLTGLGGEERERPGVDKVRVFGWFIQIRLKRRAIKLTINVLVSTE